MKRPRLKLPEWLTRLPAVSVGVVVVWLLFALVVQLGYRSHADQIRREIRGAVGLAINNPVVAVHPRLLPAVRAVMPSFEGNELLSFLRKKEASGDGSLSQQQFDALAAQAFATLDSHPYRTLGVVPAHLSPHTPLTHLLVHSGWLHLLGTVLVFLLAAPLLEELWGRRVFAVSLVLLGLAGAGAFSLAHADSDRALVGASAVVAGLVAAVVVRFRNREVNFLRWFSSSAEAELSAPAWALAVPWAIYETLLWWALPGELPGGIDNAVGYTAHAAGAVAGGILALVIAQLGWEGRLGKPPEALVQSAQARHVDFQKVVEARAKGDADRAYAMLESLVARSARNRDAVTTFWEMSVERGAPERAVPAMFQLIREELRRGADEVAVAQWRELAEHLPSALLDPPTLMRLVPVIQRVDGDEHVAVALQQAFDERNQELTPAMAAQIAQLAAEIRPELAMAAARWTLESKALEKGPRLELEALVARLETREKETPGENKEQLAPSVFYEESDRSAFGEVGDLSVFENSFPDNVTTEAVPRAAGAEALRIELAGGRARDLSYSRLRAVAVAGVRGLGPKPVIVVDLLIDGGGTGRQLSVIRLRSDRFDPRPLAPEAGKALDALSHLVRGLLARGNALALPDEESAALRPVRIFETFDEYCERVLRPAARELA